MVDLGVDRQPPSGKTGDQVQLPQGTPTIERPGVQSGGLLGQLTVVARRGQGDLADVELDIEIRIVDPVGLVET